MKTFLRFFAALTAAFLALSLYIPARYEVRYPRPVGPLFDRFYKRVHLRDIATQKPQVVFLGDSVFMRGVDLPSLAEGTGKSVYGIGVAGSASALWYAVIENNILPSPHKPETLVIVFRDTKSETRAVAKYLTEELRQPPATETLRQLPDGDPSASSQLLRETLRGGVAFHNSDLDRQECQRSSGNA